MEAANVLIEEEVAMTSSLTETILTKSVFGLPP